jgi:hypothetical protein
MLSLKYCNQMGYVQNIASKGLVGLNAKAPADAGAFLDFYFKYSGLGGTNMPTLFGLD